VAFAVVASLPIHAQQPRTVRDGVYTDAQAARGGAIYKEKCASCHGPTGLGDQAKGAPNLTDTEWLYGSSRADIRGQIWAGRGGVMPPWGKRFDPETIKALTVYVHANAGGQ